MLMERSYAFCFILQDNIAESIITEGVGNILIGKQII